MFDMKHPLYYAIDFDLNVIKLGYFYGEDPEHLATLYTESKEIDYFRIVNHSELITLYNNIDRVTSDSLSGQPFA